jgi:hypothetical protein
LLIGRRLWFGGGWWLRRGFLPDWFPVKILLMFDEIIIGFIIIGWRSILFLGFIMHVLLFDLLFQFFIDGPGGGGLLFSPFFGLTQKYGAGGRECFLGQCHLLARQTAELLVLVLGFGDGLVEVLVLVLLDVFFPLFCLAFFPDSVITTPSNNCNLGFLFILFS